MIFILSEQSDYSTSKVIKWLLHFQERFRRVNGEDLEFLPFIQLGKDTQASITLGELEIDLNEVKSYWFRRGKIQFKQETPTSENSKLQAFLTKTQAEELTILQHFLYKKLKSKNSIGDYFKGGMNKLMALQQAEACGLKIPETIVCSKKIQLEKFLKKHPKVICKPIYEMPIIQGEFGKIPLFTKVFDRRVLEQLEATFFPSLFQQCIEKKYELRVFYLEDQFFANAIFSQLDKQSTVDFRNSNNHSPIRRVPFKLPSFLEKKLKKFRRAIDLNCGSIDLIVTPEQEYVFLEVNPVGQFGMTSYSGNYNIEKHIAQFLSKSH